jgi:uncharacterized protein (DUF4415 family)
MKKMTKKQSEEIAALKRLSPDSIDFSDVPEITDWRGAIVGRFYRPIKKPLTIRLDADLLAWLRGQGKGYQTKINRILRSAMEASTAPVRR